MRRPRLADIETATHWTGRPAGTLRRWVSEGRITRHGTARRMLLDLRELPEKETGGVPKKPDTPHDRPKA